MNYEFKKHLCLLSILFLLGLVGVRALFQPGFYTSHDGEHQVVRLWHFHKGLIDGQLPVRWAGTALNGFGYPLFVFTYRLPFWLGEVFLRLGFNLTDSIKAVFIITFLASGISMYFFAQDLWKSRLAGFLSAFLYLWAPYRFLNIFVRASLGEHVTFVFLPLIFWGIWRLQKNQNFKWALVFAFGLSGLVLSHALIFQLLLLPLFIFWLGLFFSSNKRLRLLIFSFFAVLLTLGLTAYYLLPALVGKRIILGLYPLSFAEHFPTLRQLLYSRWDYGFSLPGQNDGMAFQVGIAHWLVVFLSLVFLAGGLLKKKGKFFKKNFYSLLFLLLFFLSLFLMLESSSWLWHQIVKIVYLDLPWRLLFMAVFTSSILAGFLVKTLKDKPVIFFPFCFSLFALNLYANRNHLRVNKYIFYPDSFYQENKGTTTSYNEYTPKWAISWIPLFQQWKGGRVVIQKSEAEFRISKLKSNLLELELENDENIDLDVKILYYPGWQVKIDGQRKEIDYQGGGIIRVEDILPGKHQVVASLQETTLNKAANLISLTTFLLIGFLFLKKGKA